MSYKTMNVIVLDQNGDLLGRVEGNILYDRKGEPICPLEPKSTFKEISQVLRAGIKIKKRSPQCLIIVAGYNCLNCNDLQRIKQEGNKTLVTPTSCPNGCNVSEKGFNLNIVQSDFADSETGEYYGEVDSKKKENKKP